MIKKLKIKPKYKRIVLKISGEAFSTEKQLSIDDSMLKKVVQEIKKAKSLGVEIAIVVGGGNIWRAAQEKIKGLDRVTSDYIGMLATTINALALKSSFEKSELPVRVQSAINIEKLCEPYLISRAIAHLKKGRIVILAAGTGSPYFTTDTTAALRACELNADVILKATKVDGVYSSDPFKNPKASKFQSLKFIDTIKRKLKIMDTTAFSLCMDNDIRVIVFDLYKEDNILKIVKGEKIGTLITN